MEGGGFDFFSEDPNPSVWPSQPSATGPGHAPPPRAGVDALDLNSQVAPGEDFPHLHDYGSYLQGDGEDGARRGRGFGLPPTRAPRTLGVPN
ncbi:Os03g0665301 [Oryza sativa Japonica Group]|uniref:Os03g0665301 protein n=1 Tax=Oryza sativa subsp. japonica TaxID=39947 RepID=A0A0P0W1V2_ORYSJ|nr:Os03g0665301 [Oryza sativa Japonica Group]